MTLNKVGSATGTNKKHDFSGDGKRDMLLTNTNGSVYMWTIDGSTITNGNLAIPTNGNLPPLPAGWTVLPFIGDYNGDGKSDLILQNTSSGALYIWMLDGATITGGNVSIPTHGSLPPLTGGWSIIGVGDFNGDGKSDLLLYNTNGSLYVWMIDGASIAGGPGGSISISSYGSLPTLPAGWAAEAVGDFNGDGKADVLLRNTSTGAIYIWMLDGATISGGNGGTISIPTHGSLPPIGGISSIAGVSDLSGDGKADILISNTSGGLYVWVLDGATISGGNGGSITIASHGNLPTLPAGWSVNSIVGDFNADGRADLLIQNTTGSLYVWMVDASVISGGAGGSISIPTHGGLPPLCCNWSIPVMK